MTAACKASTRAQHGLTIVAVTTAKYVLRTWLLRQLGPPKCFRSCHVHPLPLAVHDSTVLGKNGFLLTSTCSGMAAPRVSGISRVNRPPSTAKHPNAMKGMNTCNKQQHANTSISEVEPHLASTVCVGQCWVHRAAHEWQHTCKAAAQYACLLSAVIGSSVRGTGSVMYLGVTANRA